jgi:hypothetical protein
MNDEIEEPKFETVELSALESMERAQIDVQISTAKKYPRVLSTVKKEMLSFATLDEETAAGCFFTLPGRKGGDGKPIQGPSIRMAEIALATYGNLRAGARIIGDDGKMITAQGVCHDLQNNVCVSVEVKRRVTTKTGQRYGDDMIVMTGNAACSIALRNATFRVVPLALVKPIYEAAKKVAIGDAKTLVQRRAGAIAHFTKMGVTQDKIFAALQVKAIDDIGLEHLEVLIGYSNAIKEGEATIDGIFNPAKDAASRGSLGETLGEKTMPKKSPTAKEYSAADRDLIIAELQDFILDGKATEKALVSDSIKAGIITEEQKPLGLFELPTGTLAAIRDAAKGGK